MKFLENQRAHNCVSVKVWFCSVNAKFLNLRFLASTVSEGTIFSLSVPKKSLLWYTAVTLDRLTKELRFEGTDGTDMKTMQLGTWMNILFFTISTYASGAFLRRSRDVTVMW